LFSVEDQTDNSQTDYCYRQRGSADKDISQEQEMFPALMAGSPDLIHISNIIAIATGPGGEGSLLALY